MEKISYFLSLIATILGLCEPFGKNMRTILVFNFMGNLLVGISYLLVSGFSGAAICFVACAQVVTNYIFEVRWKKLPKLMVFISIVLFVAINMITFKVWYDILALMAAIIFVLSVSQSKEKYYRILYFMNSTVWVLYDFLAGAYGNLVTHIVLFVATFLAIVLHDIKGKNKQDDLRKDLCGKR